MVYKGRSTVGPSPHEIFDIPYTSVSAFVLLMSSLTMVLALAAIQRSDQPRLRIWLITTALLGSVFIGGQYYEFTTFYHEELTLQHSLFGSSLFTLTGFHGAHVTIGIFWLLYMAAALVDGPPQRRAAAVHRDRRPVLALRGHRLDRDLHGRLPAALTHAR